jgi:hypothetical protein
VSVTFQFSLCNLIILYWKCMQKIGGESIKDYKIEGKTKEGKDDSIILNKEELFFPKQCQFIVKCSLFLRCQFLEFSWTTTAKKLRRKNCIVVCWHRVL